MTPLQNQLASFMISHGVGKDQAERAAVECSDRIMSDAKFAALVGFGVGLATSNPAALVMGAAVGAGIGAGTAIGSPSCHDVREAAVRLAFDL
jgi:hypothetical protein